MLLAEIAIYIFLFVLILYLSYRVMWVVFFLFAFRFWDMILNKFSFEALETLTPKQRFMLLVILAFVTYLSVVLTTMKIPMLRYIFLAILIIAAIRVYSLTDILFFKDYLEASGMWSMDYWINQVKKVFSLKPEQIIGMFEKVFSVFVEFFVKMVNAIRGI